MKLIKKLLVVVLCVMMLATTMVNDGWLTLIEPVTSSAMSGHEQAYNDTRIELDFNKDWSFGFTDDDAAYIKGFDDSSWETVDLPHDFSMSQEFTTDGATEAENGQLPGGTGWYRKWFNLYEYYTGDRIFLNFDGAYQHTYVYVNGQYVGENHYGYNSFSFEISEYLVCTNTVLNLIAVKVVNELPTSRWYSGSGINRDVTLTIAGPVHISLYGPRITTPDLHTAEKAHANANIKMHNDTAISRIVSVEATVLDKNHNPVSETVSSGPVTISANTEKEITLEPEVKDPEEWSPENPALYKLCTIVKDNKTGEILDEYHTTFGFRCVEWDADSGFMLNHEPVKLKGVCLHHDQGALGAAQEYDAIYRQLKILKDMGCNAIRTSHNTASRVFIELCNEMGFLVIEEFFDGWDVSKNGNINDFSAYFNEVIAPENTAIGAKGQKWFQYVIEHTILRDEHAPCIIAWDIGNELCGVDDSSATGNYESIVNSILKICDTLDPDRAVLHGNNDHGNETLKMIDDKMDVIGANYNPWTWVNIMNDPSDSRSSKPFVATESASATSTRGVYNTMSHYDFACSAYDTDAVSWGNAAAQAWYYVATYDWFSGEFIWTGFDYIGEPTHWNNGHNDNANAVPNSSYFGVVDTAGFEKDSYYLYRSLWNENDTTLHLVPGSWNQDKLYMENGYVNVAVYSNAASIELLLNGTVIGTAHSTVTKTDAGYTYRTWDETSSNTSVCNTTEFYTDEGKNFYSQFRVKYSAGTLSVKAYDENGNEITDTVGSTESVTGTATQVVTSIWNDEDTFVADGADFIYAEFEARDADGNFMNDYNGTLYVKVADSSSRYAKIVGVDNGNPATTEKYQQSSVLISESEAQIQMFNGRALVILRTTEEEGPVTITATTSADGTGPSVEGATVTTVSESGIHLTDELDEVITQNGNTYSPTLYDEFEIVKYHINQLEKPEGGTGSGSVIRIYNCKPVTLSYGGSIPDGDYAFHNSKFLFTGKTDGDNGIVREEITDGVSTSMAYLLSEFDTDIKNIYTLSKQADGTYYVENKATGKYLNISAGALSFSDTPQGVTIAIGYNGTVRISAGSNYIGSSSADSYNSVSSYNSSLSVWVYGAERKEIEVVPPDTGDTDNLCYIHTVNMGDAQLIPDGNYVVRMGNYVMTEEEYDSWSILVKNEITDATAATGGTYPDESFRTDTANILKFTHQGNNTYYIQNISTGKYLYAFSKYMLRYGDTPEAITVSAGYDGSIRLSVPHYSTLYATLSFTYNANGERFDYVELAGDINGNTTAWLYSTNARVPETPSTPSTPEASTAFIRYVAGSNAAIPDGEYVLCNINTNGSNTVSSIKLVAGAAAQNGSTYGLGTEDVSGVISDDYGEIASALSENIYTFTSIGNGKYYIRNHEGKYISINGINSVTLVDTPVELCVARVNEDGDIAIYNPSNMMFLDYFISNVQFFSAWDGNLSNVSENRRFRLYSAPVTEEDGGDTEEGDSTEEGGNNSGSASGSADKLALYNELHKGISEDYSIYTRESFEKLLRCLEDGVQVFKDENSTDADYAAASRAIEAAIAALVMDIKKIDGTLFKYGYDNSNGTSDYSDGGLLMNAIAVKKMKEAILSDANLVKQIKEIIDYDDTSFYGENEAAQVLDKVAEAYAKIYTIQFTGNPYAGSPVANRANSWKYISDHASNSVPVSLWNLWTKVNTHGVNDPKDVDDGASVQGLASATLENGVVSSHTAYTSPLPYANDGKYDSDDIQNYIYAYNSSKNSYREFVLSDLSGISVYFPDLFTREALDANGNVTTATQGQFAKYYWDAEFPIFISTDEYGVNTYHFDSKDTSYLVQGEFNDDEHKVDMELNEVGSWTIFGPNDNTVDGKISGFFPFNYKSNKTTYSGESAIYHYGFTFEHNFYIPKGGKHVNGDDVIFNFSGDDDVYVYIDGVLVLDNGGLHGAREVTINFTNCSINYQFAMDVTDGELKGNEYELTYSYNKIVEGHPDADEYSADTVAALNKLHEVINDGQVHTLNFFYLERGASDSNCRMSFNLSETSEEVRIVDQVLTLDYGLPVEYNINDNNNISQAAIDNKVKVEYLGLCAVNEEVENTYTFELPKIEVPFEDGVTYSVEGMKYGTCTIDKDGNASYNLTSMNMSEAEHFYVCAKITGDPTYSEDIVYYQIEKTTFVPASTIYYEDTFNTITYTDGKVPDSYNNTQNQYGIWQTDGMQETTLKQNADLTDSEANPYGYEEEYLSFAEFSGGSLHYVNVSTKNNPNSKFSGGEGAEWPTVDFTFTGTGFDLISVTDSTSGAFSVTIKDKAGKVVKTSIVDTFYGYNYGRLYADANGKPTLDSTLVPMYRSENGTCTSDERYYDENGAITDKIHYKNGDEIVEWDTGTPAYAYAYGWVVATDNSSERLYQIPVIKITDLDYDTYSVTITPTFASMFGHSSTASDGTSYYSVYLDAIRIYSPAGEGDDIQNQDVKDAYATDDELYPSYLELKNMLIGADSLSETDAQGIIFIDGIAALDNDLATYKNAGPNNELYLGKDQAVAFEIWATAVPTDIQIGTKLAHGKPALTVSYDAKTTDIPINTATDIYYSFNTILPNDGKLTWMLVEGSDGNFYYTTGTVVIQNTGKEGSVLSVTNIKWTFSQNGGKGHFRIPTEVGNDVVLFSVTEDTQRAAYSLMRMRTAALEVEQTEAPVVATDSQGNSVVTMKLKTSTDVASLEITDEFMNPVELQNIEIVPVVSEDDGTTEWTVSFTTGESGTFTYLVTGVYANGYADYSAAVAVTFTVEEPATEDVPEDTPEDEAEDDSSSSSSIISVLAGIYKKLIEFIRTIFALFGIAL